MTDNDTTGRERHPHLDLFDHNKKWKYLIVGTFPPNSAVRDKEKLYIDYFYGNKGFLWKIIHDIYHPAGYDFFKGNKDQNLQEIKRWQSDYCVGLSDTIISCQRKLALSSDDSDLFNIEYNYPLKDYVLNNLDHLKKIIFTSSFGKNSAYENFKLIMGPEIELIRDKLVKGLPSPSGSANITFFNTNKEQTLGLTDDFYRYVVKFRPDLIKDFEERWALKKLKRLTKGANDVVIPSTPKGLVKQFKLWAYAQALPNHKCI
jgi:hypothetical protein